VQRPFTPSGQKMDQIYSTAPGTHTKLTGIETTPTQLLAHQMKLMTNMTVSVNGLPSTSHH